MSEFGKKIGAVVAGAAVVFAVGAPMASATPSATQQHPAATQQLTTDTPALQGAGDGTAAGAVAWYSAHNGSSSLEHYCEKAAENSYGTTGVWASAIAHWNGAKTKHKGDKNPPKGAFVYWNISSYGHVGVSDGAGGFWATSVKSKIGHITKAAGGYGYFGSYLGWSAPGKPSKSGKI